MRMNPDAGGLDAEWLARVRTRYGIAPPHRNGDRPTYSRSERAFRTYAVSRLDLPGTRATVLHAILLRMGARGSPCTAGYDTLAEDAAVGRSTVYKHVAAAVNGGHVYRDRGDTSPRLTVAVRPTPDQRDRMYDLWLGSEGLDEPAKQTRWRRSLSADDPGTLGKRFSWDWVRGIRDTDLDAETRGVAWAAAVLWNSRGEPYRRTSKDELAAMSGYSHETVRTRLAAMEAAGWLFVSRKRGRRGGLGLWPRIPDRALGRAGAELAR